MIDRENIIEGLQELSGFLFKEYGKVQAEEASLYYDRFITVDNAITLLKEQEAVTIKKTKEHGFGVYGGICPKCRNWIQSAHSFCGFCGQAVKWE